ncbi:pentatricopeptide repeat-containing protein At2g22410, mitochondrial-like [Juglans microcarpa x Juglans regia]|uniref:pentatricopeptide repeat-containing protein At2g22410, mitochondrial-like n=1 Tax=Juglans microcarpa x Juglans regia TaxID=2249226 RepID=UPI001B7DB665|nr:pentatricopeptide repeat-containing protein At2g22410, mitochondrial-like [Juglans microcarpa x Juglans regia]
MFCTLKYSTVGSRLKNSLFHFHSRPTTFTHRFKSPIHQNLHHLLEKCSSMRELKLIHAQIILHGLTNENLTLGKLVSFCAIADTGDLEYARLVFNKAPEPNKFMYNSLIRGYSNGDDPMEAISLYRKMIGSGLSPNEFTLPFVLKACARKLACWVAVVVHGQAIKFGTGFHVCVQNALISVYVVCGSIGCARKMFDGISERTLVSWNLMIGGYSKMGFSKEAFLLFQEMRELGVEPDEFTLVSLLSLCSQVCDLDFGRFLHLYIEITGIEIDLIVRNALLDMYAKCGHLHAAKMVFDRMPNKNVVSWTSIVTAYAKHGLTLSAQKIFDNMPVKNVVSWNSMISSYVREGRCREALDLYLNMCDLRVVPDEATLVSILSACSQIGDLVMGKKIHNYICSNSSIHGVTLYNSLIDMYAKCGAPRIALDIFYKIPEKNTVSWNAIIGALALHGRGPEAIDLFEKMQACGVRPDEITFTALLSACSHSGLIDLGRHYFHKMSSIYGLSHEIEHYACMVDLLGRGGLLEEAIRLIGGMQMKPDVVVWCALLGACRTYGNIEVGRQILKQLLVMEPYNSGLYVLLSNIYCEAERWEDVKKIRKLMDDCGIQKCRAISLIEIDGCVQEFLVDDKRHEIWSSIHSMLDQLTQHLKFSGYSCNISSAYLDVDEI